MDVTMEEVIEMEMRGLKNTLNTGLKDTGTDTKSEHGSLRLEECQ